MGVVYLVSVLALIITFILIRKTEKTLELIDFLGVTIVLLFCYNAFVCYVLTFFTIPCSLLNLSIVNFGFSLIIGLFIMRKKQIQKYNFDKISLISVIIILLVSIFASLLNFGFPFNIKYETIDPSVHYLTSVMFTEEDSLLNNTKDKIHGGFGGRKIGSYVNSGIIMECFSGVIDEIDFYNIFIGFGIFILFMTGWIMFCTLSKFTHNKTGKVLALIASIIYILGYPFNSLLFGFEYLSLSILIIGTIINMVYYFENENLNFIYYIIMFALLNFGVFCSYYLFVPFVYSALWIYFCIYSYKKDKKIICKKNAIILSVTLLVPFILGYIYHLAPYIYNILNIKDFLSALNDSINYSDNILNNSFKLFGYIYINYYSNIILFIPLTVYYVIKKNNDKDLGAFDIILLLLTILYVIVLFIFELLGKVSVYYIMKNYYILWLILIYMNFKGLVYLMQKRKIMVASMVSAYLILVIVSLAFIDVPLEYSTETQEKSIASLVEIFEINKTIIFDRNIDWNKDEIELLKYVKENIDLSKDRVEVIGDPQNISWAYSLLRYINYDEEQDFYKYKVHNKLTLKIFALCNKQIDAEFSVYLKNSAFYDIYKDDFGGETIYENDGGIIVKMR